MGNSWFRFRQFTVQQQYSAMKVTTDACLFGALQPTHDGQGEGKRMLDIGAGTGLLSLMMAQLNPLASVTAIEIEASAAREAAENIGGSPFYNRIQVFQQDVLAYEPAGTFDHIVCNPPFHEAQLSSPHKNRNIAHHSSAMQLGQLFPLAANWLTGDGLFSVLLPFYRQEEALGLAANHGFFCLKFIKVRQTPNHDFFRSILFLGRNVAENQLIEMSIRDENNQYSPEFKKLLQPFYLHL